MEISIGTAGKNNLKMRVRMMDDGKGRSEKSAFETLAVMHG